MQTKHIEAGNGIGRLIVVSDLHAFFEPLDALDKIIAAFSERVQVAAAGDFLIGGANPVETIEWVMTRAGEFAVLGNTETACLDRYNQSAGTDSSQPPYMSAFMRLSARQIKYLRNLPRVLQLHWKGMNIRILHGNNTLSGEPVPWKTKPRELLEKFSDPAVALTVTGHTHYPFAGEKDGARVANCGSTSQVILGWKHEDGTIVPQGDDSAFTPAAGIHSSFLSITEKDGVPQASVERFDYDRQGAIKRLRDSGAPDIESRKVLIETGVHGS